jgi:hypothetical protein
MKVETLATETQPGVQHCVGLPSSFEDARSITPREALLHRIPYHGGFDLVLRDVGTALASALSLHFSRLSACSALPLEKP